MSWSRLALTGLCVAAAALGPTAAGAAAVDTYVVAPGTTDAAPTSCVSEGSGSFSCPNLRTAVTVAEADSGATVQLSAGTYLLSDGVLAIEPSGGSKSLTITGAGSDETTIQQSSAGAAVIGVNGTEFSLTISAVKITGGTLTVPAVGAGAAGHIADGGGISNYLAALTLDGVAVTGNTATAGAGGASGSGNGGPGGEASGGIFSDGQLTLEDSSVTSNTATGGAGGASSDGTGTGGPGGQAAGGVLARASTGPTLIENTTIESNIATGGAGGNGTGSTGDGGTGGGGIGGVFDDAQPLTISASTISDNTSSSGKGGDGNNENAGGGGGLAGPAIGGLDDATALTIAQSTLNGNTADAGGGGQGAQMYGQTGGTATGGGVLADPPAGTTASITGTTISNNIATGGRGGIDGLGAGSGGDSDGAGVALFPAVGATVAISGSTVSGNTATGGLTNGGGCCNGGSALGAGIYDAGSGGSLTVTSTTLAGNTAVAKPGDIASGDGGNACGGGIYTAGPITLDADTISGDATAGASEEAGSPYDSGDGAGGGLCLALTSPGTEDVLNSTITGNTATGAAGPEGGTASEGLGGGIFNDVSGPLVLASDTIAANSAITGGGAGSSGGNLYMDTGTGLDATETIIANGSAATATTSNCFATSTTSGHDLESVSPSQCGFSTANGDLIGADPLLEPLAANGGATQTLALNAASPALGAGGQCIDPTQSGNPPLTVDQRGLPRSAPCDIGAFQHQPPANTTAPTASGSPAVGQTLTCTQGAWSGDQPLTFAYQWLRDGTAIASATATTYPVASSDAGHQLSCQVTAHNVYATATATSAALTVPVAHNSAPKPTITALRESHKTWREGSKLAAISRAKRNKPPPVATTFSFTLNTRATVTLTFTRTRAGRKTKIKHKTECITKTKHNTHKPTCTRTNHAGSITLTAQHGANSIDFEGRLSPTKTLKPGSYSVTALAVNATGRARSNALTFTIATS